MALIDLFLSRAVKRGVLTLIKPDGSTTVFGAADPAFRPVTMRFADDRVARQIAADPSLGAAEAWMDGRLTIEGDDLMGLLDLITGNSRWEESKTTLLAGRVARARDRLIQSVKRHNAAQVSKRNVAHHYDLSARLYDLFLDADRQYSMAYFTDPANSLEQAQADKKAHIVAKLAIEPGMRVLDIGCGWGGMALYIHAKTGATVHGITLSEEQLKIARERAAAAGVADKVTFELIDYRAVTGTFDRIVSVGMFEHVGTPQYRTFMAKCRALMPEHGVMLLHTIGRAGGPGVTDHFTAKYIFPGGYIPALSEILRANEGNKMFVTDVEVLRLHYAYTLQHWYDRAVAAKDRIVALYDERFYRMWLYYLAGSCVSFRHGGLVNYQVQFARSREALPITRDYMAEAEAALRG
ncbi:class I SAM-dependent methyltransferase [Sphingomonas sp. CJ99]